MSVGSDRPTEGTAVTRAVEVRIDQSAPRGAGPNDSGRYGRRVTGGPICGAGGAVAGGWYGDGVGPAGARVLPHGSIASATMTTTSNPPMAAHWPSNGDRGAGTRVSPAIALPGQSSPR